MRLLKCETLSTLLNTYENYNLYFLVYDLMFVHCVIGPLFIITWRGTWHNADTLFDEVIFENDFKISSLVSLIIGLVLSTCVILLQHEIRAIALKQNKYVLCMSNNTINYFN